MCLYWVVVYIFTTLTYFSISILVDRFHKSKINTDLFLKINPLKHLRISVRIFHIYLQKEVNQYTLKGLLKIYQF